MSVTARTIQLIAPSGYCYNQQAAQLAIGRLEAQGHRVTHGEIITRRYQRFAGTDEQRAQELNSLINCVTLPDIVLAVRGGYGATRLLPAIDFNALATRLKQHPVALCGHSDFTAIQLALLCHGVISFSAPMLAGNFGADSLSDFTLTHFWSALTSPVLTLTWQTADAATDVSGTVWGGNLALIASLVGTPWMPDIADGILVIEDINEPAYRIERLLLQLAYSGILRRQKAIVIGRFISPPPTDYDDGYSNESVWARLREVTNLPVIAGLEFGHTPDTVTLPLGAEAHLQVINGVAKLTCSHYPTLR